jgi:hypothetical protein
LQITSIKSQEPEVVAQRVEAALKSKGYSVQVGVKGRRVNISDVRLDDKKLETEGYNLQVSHTKSGTRRTRALSWDNWVEVNDTINSELDSMNVSANVNSLGGKFKIRSGTTAYHEENWESLKYENVGSVMYPTARTDYICSSGIPVKPKGWKNEPMRHALAAKGMKTGRKK